MSQLIFVIDPMCSWCWGFHPVIEKLRTSYSARYKFDLLVGGLRTSGQMPWTDESKAYLKQNWDAVHQATSQPFNLKLLSLAHFDYNTYPACKAIVTVRELWGIDAAFTYLSDIQSAFYAQGIDITSLEILTRYIRQDKQAFIHFYQSDRAKILMQDDFTKVRSIGVNAFPSTVKVNEDGQMAYISGYKSLEEILAL